MRKKHAVALDKLIGAAFEKNVPDKLRDDPFDRMTANHEKEQRELIQAAAEAEQRLANAGQYNIDLQAIISAIRSNCYKVPKQIGASQYYIFSCMVFRLGSLG